MSDYLVRATAANAQIRAFACTTRQTVETARQNHNSSPVATAAVGRLLSAGAMMGSMLKGEKDVLTLSIRGGGPMKGVTVTADANGNVKGYPVEPCVILPANKKGKLDVAKAIGSGRLTVIKDMGLKEPYSGQVALQTSEIAEDLTYYFATSEQVPSAVGLGVLMSKDNTVKQAGGFIIQLMPFTEDATIDKLEENLKKVSSVTDILDAGNSPEDMLRILLDGFDVEINDTLPVQFHCDCDKARVEAALIACGRDTIKEMIADAKPVEVKCQFCGQAYELSVEDLKRLLK